MRVFAAGSRRRRLANAIVGGATAALLLLASPVRAWPLPSPEFTAKVDRLMHWIAEHSDLKVPDRQPAFLFLPTDTINYVAAGSLYDGSDLVVASFAPTDAGIVFLPVDGATDDVLVHELVHFMQLTNGLKVGCVGDLEREAYRVQAEFTAETGIGQPVASITRILATSCLPPWQLP
jgi:hypothetical protein